MKRSNENYSIETSTRSEKMSEREREKSFSVGWLFWSSVVPLGKKDKKKKTSITTRFPQNNRREREKGPSTDREIERAEEETDSFRERERERERINRKKMATTSSISGITTANNVRKIQRRGSATSSSSSSSSRRVVRMMAAPGTDGTPYVAKNTFTIPSDEAGVKLEEIKRRFLEEMQFREQKMKTMPDYTSSSLKEVGANTYEFSQEWKTKEGFEGWMNTPERRRSHFPVGVYQYLPKDKWSVPENFAPVIKLKDPPKPPKKA